MYVCLYLWARGQRGQGSATSGEGIDPGGSRVNLERTAVKNLGETSSHLRQKHKHRYQMKTVYCRKHEVTVLHRLNGGSSSQSVIVLYLLHFILENIPENKFINLNSRYLDPVCVWGRTYVDFGSWGEPVTDRFLTNKQRRQWKSETVNTGSTMCPEIFTYK